MEMEAKYGDNAAHLGSLFPQVPDLGGSFKKLNKFPAFFGSIKGLLGSYQSDYCKSWNISQEPGRLSECQYVATEVLGVTILDRCSSRGREAPTSGACYGAKRLLWPREVGAKRPMPWPNCAGA